MGGWLTQQQDPAADVSRNPQKPCCLPGGTVGAGGDDAGMWMALDDANPRRRAVFGSEDAARRFAAGVPGWSVFSDRDERWAPITGRPGGASPAASPEVRQH